MRSQNSFTDKYGPWALVTGASSGIGREIALQLADRQLHVFLAGRDRQQLEATAKLVMQRGRSAQVIVVDFEQPGAMADVINATALHTIGLLAPAAGFGDSGPFVASSLGDQKAMVQVNITSVMALTHHFANRMAGQGHGGIVLIASLLAFHGAPFSAHYAATKAYIQSFGEALAVEMRGAGVDVLVSSPGPTATGFAKRAGMTMGRTMTPQAVATATLAALGKSSTVLPGGLTKLLRGSLMTLPRALQIRIIGHIMKGFSQNN
jgi:uncharacterized protein